ncbi:hypothetical protein DAMA08_039870 [Martiniozyma asiatica (nom. inval.)]|nr:hypothetical protein DAMA08_039870 [Martiniozyma asiatica]
MIINLRLPLKFLKLLTYALICLNIIYFVLLPISVVSFFHFQDYLLPPGQSQVPMSFHTHQKLSYINRPMPKDSIEAFSEISETIKELKKQYNSMHKNPFTTLSIELSVELDIVNINSTIIDVSSFILSKDDVIHMRNHPKLQPNDITNVFGQTYLLKTPQLLSAVDDKYLLDFVLPQWSINMFVPLGIYKLLNFNNILSILKGRFQKSDYTEYSSQRIVLNLGRLEWNEMNDTMFLMAKINTKDVFVTNANIVFDWGLTGIRKWVHDWPGLCFIIGVGIFWSVSSFFCIIIGIIGIRKVEMYHLKGTDSNVDVKINEKEDLLKNLEELKALQI